jgi:hypothetical protein
VSDRSKSRSLERAGSGRAAANRRAACRGALYKGVYEDKIMDGSPAGCMSCGSEASVAASRAARKVVTSLGSTCSIRKAGPSVLAREQSASHGMAWHRMVRGYRLYGAHGALQRI